MFISVTTYYYESTKKDYAPTDSLVLVNLSEISTISLNKKGFGLVSLTLKGQEGYPLLVGKNELDKLDTQHFLTSVDWHQMKSYLKDDK